MSIPDTRPNRRLSDARRAAGLTQAELGARTGLSQRLISSIESGTRQGSTRALERIARALGVSVSYLIGERVRAWEEGGGRTEILADPLAAQGLQSLARNGALCELLAVTPEEWAALRGIELSYGLSQDAYLAILHILRGGRG